MTGDASDVELERHALPHDRLELLRTLDHHGQTIAPGNWLIEIANYDAKFWWRDADDADWWGPFRTAWEAFDDWNAR